MTTTEATNERLHDLHDEGRIDISSEPWNTDNYAVDHVSEMTRGRRVTASPPPVETLLETPDDGGRDDDIGVNNDDDGDGDGDGEVTDNDTAVDNDDITEIGMDGDDDDGARYGYFGGGGGNIHANNRNGAAPGEVTTQDERRRDDLVEELRRIQRTNFVHFAVLFLVPTGMIVLVMWNAISRSEVCDESVPGIDCSREVRRFVHAFTSRCLCHAIEITEDYEDE